MAKDTCIATPDAPNGEPSRLYKNLLNKFKDRPLVNWIYSCYRSSMANHLGETNRQGEHSMQKVLDNIDISKIENDRDSLDIAAKALGAIDSKGNPIPYTNAEEALRKAHDFNTTHKGTVATVNKHGDIYYINVFAKEAGTNTLGDIVKSQLEAWDIYKQAFNAKGVDITNLPQEVQNVINASNTDIGGYLRSLGTMSIQNIYRNQALTLFSLSPNSQHIQNIINKFGSIEEAAQVTDDFNHGRKSLTSAEQTLLTRAIRDARNFSGVDIDALIKQVKNNTDIINQNSVEQAIKKDIDELSKKYGTNKREINRKINNIQSLSDAAAEACIVLQRKIKELEKMKGKTDEVKQLKIVLNNMFKELNSKHYSYGVLQFLNESAAYINDIPRILEEAQKAAETKTGLENAMEIASALQQIKLLHSEYYPIIEALASGHLAIDESIDQIDIDNIRKSAKDLIEIFDERKDSITKLTRSNMIAILGAILPGKQGPRGESLSTLVDMAAEDSGYFDYFYRKDTLSNPVLAVMGTILKRAQDKRDAKLNKIDLRIRRATNKLYKAGYTSEFMYDVDTGRIISNIKWNKYEEEKAKYKGSLMRQHLSKFEIQQEMDKWEYDNTKEIVVDHTTGRTERVPNEHYEREPYYEGSYDEEWSEVQKEYYKEMMELKGEIGTLLPDYAQDIYSPPQLREKFIEAAKHGIGRAVKNKIQDFYKIREDDTHYSNVDGETYRLVDGSVDNTPKREIPIFFVDKVKRTELLKNFSAGLIALASTAVNYECLNEVKDTVEFMADFVENQKASGNIRQGESVESNDIRITKELFKRGRNTNTLNIVQGMLSMQLYMNKWNPEGNKAVAKMMSNILQYTSFKNLSTNWKGAVANGLMGEFQMMIEAGCGEFYNWNDFKNAHLKLFGKAGLIGEIMNLLTNNVNSKACLMREKFDPVQENFSDISHKGYYKSAFRQLLSKDLSFIGYSSGEDVIHYVNMYAVLEHEKVKLDGKKISLYDALEVSQKVDGNSELVVKQGATRLDGSPITEDYLQSIKGKIAGVNSNCHGSMRDEDKGIIHQRILGRCVMNFRQWMVEHYARRFRKRHFDANFNAYREGYWVSLWNGLFNEDTVDTWKSGHHLSAIGLFMKDLLNFTFRSATHWHNLTDDQKSNIKRVKTEMMLCMLLIGFGAYLGEPEEHKKEAWRRFFIYQNKRMLMDEWAAIPILPHKMIYNALNILNSPMSCISTMEALLYLIFSPGDMFETIKIGKHKGENRYWRNVKKYVLPFYKDYEQFENMDTDDTIFKPFTEKLGTH